MIIELYFLLILFAFIFHLFLVYFLYFFCLKFTFIFIFRPFYRTEMVIVTRPGNHSDIVHNLPPPSAEQMNFNPIFDLDFMHQVILF